MMRPTREFLRATGAAGILAGIVTLTIVVLPEVYGTPRSLDEQIALHTHPLYQLDQWLSFLNVFAILTASWGLAAHRLRDAPGAASVGMLFMVFYGAAELLGRSAMIFAREYRWVHGLVEAEGRSRTELIGLIQGFDAVWSGWFMLILIAFSLSAFLFGWATRGGPKLQRATSWGLLVASALGLVTFASVYIPLLRPVATWGYVIVQPGSRFLVGAYLWSESRHVDAGYVGPPSPSS